MSIATVLCTTSKTLESLGVHHNNDARYYSQYNHVDRQISQSPSSTIVAYSGQMTGRDDHHIRPGAFYFRRAKKNKPYYFVGRVVRVVKSREGDRRTLVPAEYLLVLDRAPLTGRFGHIYDGVVPQCLPAWHPHDGTKTWFDGAGPKRQMLFMAGVRSQGTSNASGISQMIYDGPETRDDRPSAPARRHVPDIRCVPDIAFPVSVFDAPPPLLR
jgi:hypothetical protein